MSRIYNKDTITTPKDTKQQRWRRSGFFIVNFEYTSHLVLLFSAVLAIDFFSKNPLS